MIYKFMSFDGKMIVVVEHEEHEKLTIKKYKNKKLTEEKIYCVDDFNYYEDLEYFYEDVIGELYCEMILIESISL